ncbi:Polyadenylate-binding protein RBP47C [Galdieria sulphuraria]|nr:Polyadenylate-binding protein RBP47C [Galdieria sulphuraria]
MVLSRRSFVRRASFSECSLDYNEIDLNYTKSPGAASWASTRSCPTQVLSSNNTPKAKFDFISENTSLNDENMKRTPASRCRPPLKNSAPPTAISEKRIGRRLFADDEECEDQLTMLDQTDESLCQVSAAVSFMVTPGSLHEKFSVFVGDLGGDINEDILLDAFSRFGKVTAVDLKRDKYTGEILGYAFVYFVQEEEAQKAMKLGNGMSLMNRRIRTGCPQRNATLHIPQIDSEINDEEIKTTFRKYGELVEEETYFIRRCYGYIRFQAREDAERAKQHLDGATIGKFKIRVEWANTELLRYAIQFHFEIERSNLITVESVKARMTRFGTVTKIEIFSDDQGQKTGLGRVYFTPDKEGELAASKAVKFVKYISGTKVWCTFLKVVVPKETLNSMSTNECNISVEERQPTTTPSKYNSSTAYFETPAFDLSAINTNIPTCVAAVPNPSAAPLQFSTVSSQFLPYWLPVPYPVSTVPYFVMDNNSGGSYSFV